MGFYLDEAPETQSADVGSGNFFIDNTPAPVETPSLFEDPIGALTSADWWTTRPSGEKIGLGQAVAGPASKALSGLTLGFGDEIAAGGNSILDFLLPRKDSSLGSILPDILTDSGQTYDQRLAEARGVQKSFEEASPYIAGGLEIGGALKTPLLNIASKVNAALPAAKTIPQALLKTGGIASLLAGEGAVYGGVSGFGSGEGEAGRIQGALEGAESGAKWSAALGTPFVAASELASVYSDKIEELSKAWLRRTTGATKTDYNKTAKEIDFWDIPEQGDIETATKKALDALDEKGILPANRDPQGMLKGVLTEERRLTKDIDTAIKAVDDSGSKIHPDFDSALTYLAEGKVKANEVERYLGEIEDLSGAIKAQGKGKLSYLQQQKIATGGKYNPDDGAANGFWRAVYHDLQDTIEKAAPDVAPLNNQLKDIKITKPIFQKGVTPKESKNFIDAIFERLRTSGAKTIMGPAIGASAAFGSGAGLPAMAVAGAAGYFATPQGQTKIANTLKTLAKDSGKPLSYFEKWLPNIGQLASPSITNADPIEKAMIQAENKIAMKTPLEAKRIPSNESFVSKEEGGQVLKAYPPPAKGSGVSVATGIDLGQRSRKELEDLGVSSKTISKVSKYLGAKDATARKLLKEYPLTLKKEEADELDNAIHSDIYGTVEAKLKDKGVNFNKLPPEAQSVIKSISLNFGKNFDESLPSIWKAITQKDWAKVQDLLVNTKWKQPELVARRKREADLLSVLV